MKKNRVFSSYIEVVIFSFAIAGFIVAIMLGAYHASQMDSNPVTVEETSEVVEEDEGPDFMLLPLPGGIPVGGGLYIW